MYKRYFRRIIAFVIVLSMVFTTVAMAMPYGQAKKFIRNGYSWEQVQKYVKGKGIMKGFPDGKFYENHNVKRADVIVMVNRAFKLSALIDSLNENYKDIFDDVDENEYYFHSIYIAKALGITKGKGNNKFFPKHSVTIGEVILLIERAMDKNKYLEFDEDIDLSEDYKDLVGKNKDLDDFATRGEIAAMLYYVLTGSKYDSEPEDEDLKKISRTIKEDEILRFNKEYGKRDSIIESIEDQVDDLDYVQFTKPLNKDNNFLYDEYDEDSRSNSFVTKDDKYYVEPNRRQMALSEITIVPKSSGVLKIEYKAYDDEGDSYKGLIEITVEDDERYDLEDIKFTGYENTPLNFRISKFKEVFDKEFDYKSDDKISFKLPNKKFGTLYFDKDENGKLRNSEKIEAKNSFTLKEMDRIYFYPAENYVDEKTPVVIKYTVEDKGGNLYDGNINITVKYLFDKLTIDEDDDFGFEIKDYLEEFDDYDFETILFERLNKDDDYDLNFKDRTRSLIGRELDVDDLEDVVFNYDRGFDGTTLKYTVSTDDGLEFTGLVTVK